MMNAGVFSHWKSGIVFNCGDRLRCELLGNQERLKFAFNMVNYKVLVSVLNSADLQRDHPDG